MEDLGHANGSAVLFDLGVSSPQFDIAERGFSYRHDGPLDMRMDRRQRRTAADVVNGYPEPELASVLRRYGDERFATRIARAIVAARPVEGTAELADLVRGAIPAAARRTGGHPARRTFQALRIEVNDELAILASSVDQAIDFLAPGGRCAVIAYHSGEDRIVKERFRHHATGGVTPPPGLPLPDDVEPAVRLVRGVPKTPSASELAANPRAESARLRVVEKLPRRSA
jgi:16S rRNA (cytosine1402-N4)-methyltransferase